MFEKNATAARGTAVLVISHGCYFALGYVAVVLMAREFGPAAYGAYGVIMSVLVWLEESGRSAIPFAAAKLVAERAGGNAELERTALVLNLGLHFLLFAVLWAAAPYLSSWFGFEDGTLLFRVAAIDLPFFGAYTAFRAIHQGHQRFYQLGCSQVIYALTKLVGVLFLIHYGLSVKNALLVNVAATIAGLMCLLPRGGLRWQGRWVGEIAPLVSSATSMGLYNFALLLRGWLILWTLQIMSPSSDVMIGVFVAAQNIARVPSLALATVTTVVLPAVSRAVALNDKASAGRLINQALRFGFIFYLPACLVLMTEPEKIMHWVYSEDFSGGGIILALLIAGEGLHMIHAILGTALTAAGEARQAAVVTAASLIPALLSLILFIHFWGGAGAALSRAVTNLAGCVILGILVWKHFGILMNRRNAWNIGAAGCFMFLGFAVLSNFHLFFFLACIGGLVAYFIALICSREITCEEFAPLIPW